MIPVAPRIPVTPMLSRLFALLLCSILLTACSSSGSSDKEKYYVPADTVMALCQPYIDGNYEAAVAEMESCDKQTEAYRLQMVALMRQNAKGIQKTRGGVSKADVLKVEKLGRAGARAYLHVTYLDNSTETVLILLSHDGQRWRLR